MADKKSSSSSTTEASSTRVLPSDVTSIAQANNLTQAEAERVAAGESVDTVKGERTVYRVRYEALEPTASIHPLAAADAAAARRDAEASATVVAGPDPALPQSGPYGPNADYEPVSAPEDKDHVAVELLEAEAKK